MPVWPWLDLYVCSHYGWATTPDLIFSQLSHLLQGTTDTTSSSPSAATLVTINYQKPDCSFCDEIQLEQNYNLKPLWIEIGNKNQSEEAFEFTWTWYYLYELWLTIYFTWLPNDTHWIFVMNSSYLYKKPKDPWFMKGFNFLYHCDLAVTLKCDWIKHLLSIHNLHILSVINVEAKQNITAALRRDSNVPNFM